MISYRKDIVWIDWAKFICMLFVYWCHLGMFCNIHFHTILIPYGPIFINTFFVISGYLFFKKQLQNLQGLKGYLNPLKILNFGGVITNTCFKIAIPSLLFSLLFAIPRYIVRDGEHSLYFETFIKTTYWFTSCLCVSQLILFIMFILIQRRDVWLYFLLSIPIFICGNLLIIDKTLIMGNESCPWFYKQGMVAVFLMAIGGLYYRYESIFDSFSYNIFKLFQSRIILVCIYLVLYIFISLLNIFHFSSFSVQFGFDIEGIIYSIFSVLLFISICKSFNHHDIVKFVSRHTIGFYFLSAAVPYIWAKIIDSLFVTHTISFIGGVLCSFLTSYFLIYHINRYMPYVFDTRLILKKNEKKFT